MTWLERDHTTGEYTKPVAPGTRRSYVSKAIHAPHTEVEFIDDHTARVFVPFITIDTGTDNAVELRIERQSFSVMLDKETENERTLYRAVYKQDS